MLNVLKEKNKPEPSLPEIARIIAEDVGLASAVLKTINSPFFGMRREIKSIQQAVMLLGMSNVANLVTGYSMRNSMQGKSSISLERFWDTTSNNANISAAIASRLKLGISTDEAYMLGLFIDCGIPVMANKFDDYKETLIESNSNPDIEMTEIEDIHYSSNHAVIGFYISRSWGLPEHIRQAILQHHDRETLFINDGSQDDVRRDRLIAVQKMAENINHTYHHLSDHLEWERIGESTLEYIGITDMDYEDLKEDIHSLLNEC